MDALGTEDRERLQHTGVDKKGHGLGSNPENVTLKTLEGGVQHGTKATKGKSGGSRGKKKAGSRCSVGKKVSKNTGVNW